MTAPSINIQSGSRPLATLKRPWLMAHGGAGPQDPKGDKRQEAIASLNNIFQMEIKTPGNWPPELLKRWTGLSDLQKATIATIRNLENEAKFNAGFGASLQADGRARLSASYMESENQRFSGVVNVEDYIHPIDLAWWLQGERFSILDSMGSEELLRRLNLPRSSPIEKQRIKAWIQHRRQTISGLDAGGRTGTVGVIGVSKEGQQTAATSTGGVGNETPGRIGDSPTVAGNYCADGVALSCTGFGEQIIAMGVGPRIATSCALGQTLKASVERLLEEAKVRKYSFALIALHKTKADQIEWVAGSVNCQMVWGLKDAN